MAELFPLCLYPHIQVKYEKVITIIKIFIKSQEASSQNVIFRKILTQLIYLTKIINVKTLRIDLTDYSDILFYPMASFPC